MRLRFSWPWQSKRSTTSATGLDPIQRQTTLDELGALLQSRREAQGLSLRQLASETRITTPVIEALERGWGDRLPERAYLASMLPQLERRLALPLGALNPVLPPAELRHRPGRGGLGRFTPGSIDVLTTWQGTVLYAVVIGLSLLVVNRQQLNLAVSNAISLEPVPLDLDGLERKEASLPLDLDVAALRPLQQALQRQPLEWLNDVEQNPPAQFGVLTLKLAQPSQLALSSGGGERFSLSNTEGSMTLQLQLPIQISVDPVPSVQDQLLWNGERMTEMDDSPGTYRVEAISPAAPSSERPQTDPRSP